MREIHALLERHVDRTWHLNGRLEQYPGGADAWLVRYFDAATPKPANPILASKSKRAGV